MRKLLILSALLVTAGTAGCTRGPCGETWRPGYYLFGAGRQNNQYQNYAYQNYQQPGGDCCYDSSYGSADATMMMAPAPVMTQQAPCCQ